MMQRTTLAIACALVLAGASPSAQEAVGQPKFISTEDYVQILQLYANYTQAVDLAEDDGSAYASVFADDGELKWPGTAVKGKKAIAEWAKKSRGTESMNRHVFTNMIVTKIDEKTAHVAAYMMVVSVAKNPPVVMSNRVTDDLVVKTPQGWRIRRRSPSQTIKSNTPF